MTSIPFSLVRGDRIDTGLFTKSVFRPSTGGMSLKDRWIIIHRKVKRMFVHPVLNHIRKMLGRHLIRKREDIPDEWYNAHIRIFYDSFVNGLDDMWIHHHMRLAKRDKNKYHQMVVDKFGENYTDAQYLWMIKWICKLSDENRKLIIDIATTEVMEDTIDRTWIDCAMMNAAHSMMELYGVSEEERKKIPRPGQFPIYDSYYANNPLYFIKNKDRRKWS